VLNQDGVYTIIGTNRLPESTHRGRQDLLDRLPPSGQNLVAPPVFTVSEIIVEKDRAVVLASGNGEGPYGPYISSLATRS
jgi:hypothetical protein